LSTPPLTTSADDAPQLPAGLVQLARTAQGIELYFPPLRAPAAALGLAAFGVVCTAMPAAAGAAIVSALGFDAHGLLVIALLAGFVVPFFAFGLTFTALAVYQLANSLYVRVERAGIATARRAFGLTFARRLIAAADIVAIKPQIPSRFQSPFAVEPSYRLVAVPRDPARDRVIVAENLIGEALMERIKKLIEDAANISRSEEV
jgi:hypothetical protein